MTPLERVRRGRRRLLGVVILTAMLWAVVAGVGVATVAGLLALVTTLPQWVRVSVLPAAAMAGTIAVAVVAWRGRAARSVQRVALWIEEQQPDLRYTLVTAVDPLASADGLPTEVIAGADRAEIEGFVRRAGTRSLLRAGIATSVAILAGLLVAPLSAALLGADVPAHGVAPGAPAPSRLLGLRARVAAPGYSRLPVKTLSDPQVVEALVGSVIAFSADGAPAGVTISVGADTLAASADGGRWTGSVRMPREPGMATLRDREHQRLVVLSPRVDSAPAVSLVLPRQDTVWPKPPRGALALEARATDDLGLSYGHFEYLISTGSGEQFQTVTVLGTRMRLGLASSSPLRASVDLDTMKLAPGTVLSIRAVAVDANDVTGPGRGVSDTRTLRVAEKPDTTSVTAVPPLPIDSTWMSQRLLNMKTDTLVRGRKRLTREAFVSRSTQYATGQEAIRQRVVAVIQLLEDDGVGGTFQTDVSKLLRQADKEMWEARLNLGIAHPDSALPYMRRALKILDDVRTAYRYYLRGLQRPIVVDIDKARLQATDPAAAAAASGRQRLADAAAELSARIEAAALLFPSARQAALDSLTYVQLGALSSHPAAAKALTGALEALRAGAAPDSALAGTRRVLAPPSRVVSGPAEWAGAALP
jgi:hypothetical protein